MSPTLGWDGLVARLHAVDHARVDRAAGAPWSCGCSSCVIARRDVVLLAVRRFEMAELAELVAAQLADAGEDLVLP